MSTTAASTEIAEISAEAFERELRAGLQTVVIDTRDPALVAAWRIDPNRAELVNVPGPELRADPAAVAARLPRGRAVRVICNAGNASKDSTRALRGAGVDAASVSGGMIGWGRVLTAAEIPLAGSSTRIIQFRREARGCLSYLVVSDAEALVVDPAPSIDAYLEAASALGARITRVFDTHIHADHLSGARALAEATSATLSMSELAITRGASYPLQRVVDGDAIALGSAEIRVLALPGHTSDLSGLLVDGAALIGGDSLFADSVARPDLEVGDAGMEEAAHLLYHTLQERILALPEATLLLPCHYAGGRLDAPIAPTLAQVRGDVRELSLAEGPFVGSVLESMPPRPANYLSIIAVNLGDAPLDDAAARLEVGANNCAAKKSWDDRS